MKKTKVLLIEGRVMREHGETVHTLARDIEKAINDFSESVDGNVADVDVKVDFANMLSTGGRASVVIQYDGKLNDKPVAKAKGGK